MRRKTENKEIKDTGLRGRFNGELYVDKKVFFKRKDVQNVIKAVRSSESLKKHIKENKPSLKPHSTKNAL